MSIHKCFRNRYVLSLNGPSLIHKGVKHRDLLSNSGMRYNIKLDKISVHILTAISRFGQEMTSFNRSTVFYLVMRLTNINTSFLIQREENGMTITSLITRDHFLKENGK